MLRTVAPFAIGEEDGGLVFGDEFLKLRNHVRVDVCPDVLVGVDIPTVDVAFPFGQGVIEAHFEAFFADSFGQLATDVAFWSDLN